MTPVGIVSSVFVSPVPKHLHTSSNPGGLEERGRAGIQSAGKEETKWVDLPFASL